MLLAAGVLSAQALTPGFQCCLRCLRIAPHPVPLFLPDVAAAGRESHPAAIVGFVPADRVEDEPSVVDSAVFERLAVDNVRSKPLDELRFERAERAGELPVGKPVALEGAGDLGFVDQGLVSGKSLCGSGYIESDIPCQKLEW